jgi:urease accessory protein
LDSPPHGDPAATEDIESGPRGRLELTFARDPSGRTYLRRQFASYPYHICRPLTFSGDPAGMATLYLQSCAGGIFREDRLWEHIVAEHGTTVHVTTQAATIVHGMDRGRARQRVSIDAGPDSLVEVLPDPFILFPGARLASSVRISADAQASVCVADSFLCHDPAGGGAMFDWFEGDLSVEDVDGRLLACDRFRVAGEAIAERLPGITGVFTAQGSLFVVDRRRPARDIVDALRQGVAAVPRIYAGASELPNACGAWLRIMAEDGVGLRAGMSAAWQSVRLLLTGSKPAPRRK